jgi:hypothetical protein
MRKGKMIDRVFIWYVIDISLCFLFRSTVELWQDELQWCSTHFSKFEIRKHEIKHHERISRRV